MKTSILCIVFILLLAGALAHDKEEYEQKAEELGKDLGEHEDTFVGHQLRQVVPFTQYADGHLYAGTFLLLLWVAFFYSIYALLYK